MTKALLFLSVRLWLTNVTVKKEGFPGKSVARTIRCTFLSLQPWLPTFFPLL
nr:MAG TPA: hypothetical protein [Caudoviricetes sp.]